MEERKKWKVLGEAPGARVGGSKECAWRMFQPPARGGPSSCVSLCPSPTGRRSHNEGVGGSINFFPQGSPWFSAALHLPLWFFFF